MGVQNVWNFRFNTPDPVQLAANPWEGVMHTSDLYFLFDGEIILEMCIIQVELIACYRNRYKVSIIYCQDAWTRDQD